MTLDVFNRREGGMRGEFFLSVKMMTLFFLFLLQGIAAAQDDIQFGVIRWDSWYQGNPMGKALNLEEFRNRAPYYAIKNPSGQLTVAGDLENVLRADIDYAYSAGIDYFIFGYYPETGSWGRDPTTMRKLNRALRSYLNAPNRHLVRFAISINQSSPDDDLPDLIAALADFVSDPNYVRTQSNTAPIFVFGNNPERWILDKGSADNVSAFFRSIRSGVEERSGVKLTFVLMAADPSKSPEFASAFALDMSTFYAHGAGHSESVGREKAATECLRDSEAQNNLALVRSKQVIPNVTIGWDFRPAVEAKGDEASALDRRADWCLPYDDKNISDMLNSAVQEAQNLKGKNEFQSVVIYAWNEFVEGGYVSPTMQDGTRILSAMRDAIGRNRSQDVVTLTWPLVSNATECRIRTDARAIDQKMCSVDKSLATAWPCPPGMVLLRDEIRAATGLEANFDPGGWVVRSCKKL